MVSIKRLEVILLALVLLTAIFLRFWQIKDYIVFLGDEGRDMITMREMILERRPTFLGPTASVGGFYLGPIYYWMAAPFLALAGFDPVGPAYLVAILGVVTVFVLYKFLRETLGFWPAILASSLYTVNPLIVRYSRSSWNPNPLPLFALLLIYFLYLGITKKKYRYFILAGACFGVVIQLHYLATILLAIAGLIILVNTNFRLWIQILVVFMLGAVITFSPFLLFEIKHNFPNFNTIWEFVTRGTTLGFKSLDLPDIIASRGNQLFEDLVRIKGTIITKILFWVLTLTTFWGLIRRKDRQKKLIFSIGLIWFLGGLAGLRFYTGEIYDYYYGFMFPAPFVLAAIGFSLAWSKNYLKILVGLLTFSALVWFAANGFFRKAPNRLINQTETIADLVIERSEGQPFNFALITDNNSDHAYRYILEIKGQPPTELETLVTEQLLVVCESPKCAPLGHPIWEIAGFGRAQIIGEWYFEKFGIRVFKLDHWPGAPSPAGKPAIKGV